MVSLWMQPNHVKLMITQWLEVVPFKPEAATAGKAVPDTGPANEQPLAELQVMHPC